MNIEVVGTVHAPVALVRCVYADYSSWPRVFPLITGVRLLARRGMTAVLEIDHAEGRVINELTVERERIVLSEQKRHYDAVFVNQFRPLPEGTRVMVRARIRFKGGVRLLRPVLGSVARHQISRWQLQPLINACESRLTSTWSTSRPDRPVSERSASTAA